MDGNARHSRSWLPNWCSEHLKEGRVSEGREDHRGFGLTNAHVYRINALSEYEEFEVCVVSEQPVVRSHALATMAALCEVIPDLDDQARAIPCAYDSEEYLAYVSCYGPWISLGYFATAFNSNWEVLFERQKDGRVIRHGILPPDKQAILVAQSG